MAYPIVLPGRLLLKLRWHALVMNPMDTETANKMSSNVNVRKRTYNVAVVGATGAVGLEMIRMLDDRKFPVESLRLFASERSKGKEMPFRGRLHRIDSIDVNLFKDIDIAIFSAGAAVSKELAPKLAAMGIFVIDNSSAWRMESAVPLVVPEVNPHVLAADKKIIANPNCSTIQMVVALKPIHSAVGLSSVRVATYQAVSGAGGAGIQDLENQTKAWAAGNEMPSPKKIPHQIAFNLVPQIDVFTDNDYTKEEMKMVNETRKIMEIPELLISATCVRVPVFRSHSEAVWIETKNPISVGRVRELLSSAPGVDLMDSPNQSVYPMPHQAAGQQTTYVGRIRKDLASPNGLVLWVVSDNLLKGAALNAVQIAEELVKRELI